VNRFQFIADHSKTYKVKRLCQILDVVRSSYYKWRATRDTRAERRRSDDRLAEKIQAIHAESDRTYGSPRVTAELHDAGVKVNEKRVARVMRERAIVGVHLRKKTVTTISEPSDTPVPDLFKRDFNADAPNLKYMGDVTYLPTGDGEFLYLATVLDCFSRRVVGWSIADHMRTELISNALQDAAATRGSLDGAIFHSDHGSQYTSKDFAKLCKKLGVTQSMGAVGTSADNAACESFHASLKREVLQGAHRWDGAANCRRTVFRWINRYNTWRRHSATGNVCPIEFERQHEHQSSNMTLTA
jgi:transposase InsO family protein